MHQETEARLAAEVRAADTLAEATAIKENVFTLTEQVQIAEAAREDADARTTAIELELNQTSTATVSAEALAIRLEADLADCQASLAASRAETQSALATVLFSLLHILSHVGSSFSRGVSYPNLETKLRTA